MKKCISECTVCINVYKLHNHTNRKLLKMCSWLKGSTPIDITTRGLQQIIVHYNYELRMYCVCACVCVCVCMCLHSVCAVYLRCVDAMCVVSVHVRTSVCAKLYASVHHLLHYHVHPAHADNSLGPILRHCLPEPRSNHLASRPSP